jgi:hypothetical protein
VLYGFVFREHAKDIATPRIARLLERGRVVVVDRAEDPWELLSNTELVNCCLPAVPRATVYPYPEKKLRMMRMLS